MVDNYLQKIVGARLDRVTLYSSSIKLDFDQIGYFSFSLSTSCDFLVQEFQSCGDYPLSREAFSHLTAAIDSRVESLTKNVDGNYEFRIGARVFILRDEGAMDGIFRLAGRPAEQEQWDMFF